MSWLIRRFGPRIRLDGSRERFVWRFRDRELVLTPVMYLDTDRHRILAVGGAPPAAPHREVSVFDDPEVFEKFMKYGFEQILGRRLTIRPVVHATVTGLDAQAVERTLRRAGAGVVEVGT